MNSQGLASFILLFALTWHSSGHVHAQSLNSRIEKNCIELIAHFFSNIPESILQKAKEATEDGPIMEAIWKLPGEMRLQLLRDLAQDESKEALLGKVLQQIITHAHENKDLLPASTRELFKKHLPSFGISTQEYHIIDDFVNGRSVERLIDELLKPQSTAAIHDWLSSDIVFFRKFHDKVETYFSNLYIPIRKRNDLKELVSGLKLRPKDSARFFELLDNYPLIKAARRKGEFSSNEQWWRLKAYLDHAATYHYEKRVAILEQLPDLLKRDTKKEQVRAFNKIYNRLDDYTDRRIEKRMTEVKKARPFLSEEEQLREAKRMAYADRKIHQELYFGCRSHRIRTSNQKGATSYKKFATWYGTSMAGYQYWINNQDSDKSWKSLSFGMGFEIMMGYISAFINTKAFTNNATTFMQKYWFKTWTAATTGVLDAAAYEVLFGDTAIGRWMEDREDPQARIERLMKDPDFPQQLKKMLELLKKPTFIENFWSSIGASFIDLMKDNPQLFQEFKKEFNPAARGPKDFGQSYFVTNLKARERFIELVQEALDGTSPFDFDFKHQQQKTKGEFVLGPVLTEMANLVEKRKAYSLGGGTGDILWGHTISTGNKGLDRWTFYREWYFLSAIKSILVGTGTYRVLCVNQNRPAVGYSAAILITLVDRLVTQNIHFKTRNSVIGF